MHIHVKNYKKIVFRFVEINPKFYKKVENGGTERCTIVSGNKEKDFSN